MTDNSKWDLVDDIVSFEPASQERRAVTRIRTKLSRVAIAAVAGTIVTVGSTALATSANNIRVTSYGASGDVAITKSWVFVRPRITGRVASGNTDTQVGMSTRRLGELHRTLFSEERTESEELTGDYSFL